MITSINVSKDYGSFRALDNVSFDINMGEVVGFLGQNGAGKTTLMRILTTFLPASSGKVRVNGVDIHENPLIVRKYIGYLPETPALYPHMRVREYLIFAARIKDVAPRRIKIQLDRVLADCNLKEVADNPIATLSKGYKQRLGIAQAIIHDPKVLILDEPTSGLDPVQNMHVRGLIEQLRFERTIIVSTHILSEIEQVAQRLLVIKSGRIIVDGELKSVLANASGAAKRAVGLEEFFIQCHPGGQ